MKRRTMTLLLALCLVFTLLPFAASAEDTTASVETEHFKVTVTMDPDDAVYSGSTAAIGDYFNIPIEIGITAKAATTNLTVDKVEAALKREEGSESLDNEYYNLLICFGNHYVAELSLIVVKDKGQLVMYEYPDESATPYETYSDSGKVVTEGAGVGPFKLYAAESKTAFPSSIETGNIEDQLLNKPGIELKGSAPVTVPEIPGEDMSKTEYYWYRYSVEDSSYSMSYDHDKNEYKLTLNLYTAVSGRRAPAAGRYIVFYCENTTSDESSIIFGPAPQVRMNSTTYNLEVSRDADTWAKECIFTGKEAIDISIVSGTNKLRVYAIEFEDEEAYLSALMTSSGDFGSYVEENEIEPTVLSATAWIVEYDDGVDDDSVTGMPKDTVVAGGGSVAPGNPSRENYVFKGWDSGSDGVADYQPGEAIENISSDLTLTAVWAPNEYTVSFDSAGGSEVLAQTVKHGQAVNKPADPTRAGYAFEGWYVGDTKYDFTQPVTSNITLTAKWREIFTVTLVYGRGDIETVPVNDGEPFTLRAPTKPGYIFMGWKYGDATYQAGEKFTVTGDMTFTAVWANMPDITPGTPDTPDEPDGLPFTDVREGQWFYEAVKYVYGAGIMNGMDRYTFQPNGTLTRAMVWTMLARLDGVDTEGGSTWYARAQAWAMDKGVSDGTEPMGNITREQLVTMLYRFAEMNGADMTQGGMGIREYEDYAEISDWALTAMAWAVNNGIIEGDAGALKPTSTCTRAEAAAMFMRSCNNIL